MTRSLRNVSSLVMVVSLLGCASGSAGPAPTENSAQTATPGSGDAIAALAILQQGYVLLQQGQYDAALSRFQDADRTSPGNATTANMIGVCYLNKLEYDKALEAFNRALKLKADYTDARNNRGATYLAADQYRMAEVDFVAVLADPTYTHRWEVYYNLGMTYLLRGQLGSAKDNFRRAATAPVPVFEAFIRLAEIAQEQGENQVAIDLLDEARLKFPERREAGLALGRLYVALDRFDDARPLLEGIVAADPHSDNGQEAAQLLASGG
jgi:Tfp pilus assembly protein PilF